MAGDAPQAPPAALLGRHPEEMTILQGIVLALAAWRLSSLFVAESGPFKVFQRIREAVGIQHDADGHIAVAPETLLAGILGCVWCLSLYIGVIVALCALLWPVVTFWLALPLALSAAAIWIDSKVVSHG